MPDRQSRGDIDRLEQSSGRVRRLKALLLSGLESSYHPRRAQAAVKITAPRYYFLVGSGYANGSVTAGCVGNIFRGSGFSLFAAGKSNVASTTEAWRKSRGRR